MSKRLRVAAQILVLSVLAGCASAPSTLSPAERRVAVDTHVLRAELALQRQDSAAALDQLGLAAQLSDDAELAERTTDLAYQLGELRAGERAAERWRDLAPGDPRPIQFLAFFAAREQRLDDALGHLTELVDRAANMDASLALIADLLATQTDAVTGVALMQRLTQHYPSSARAHYGLARLAMRAGDIALALQAAAAAAALEPAWLDAQLLHARMLMLAGQTEQGLELAAALAERHDTLEVELEYAELLLSAGHAEDAERRLNAILERQPGLPEAIRALAFLGMTQSELGDAREYFNQLRNDPRYREEAFYYLGRIAETERQFLQATRSYARVIEGTHAVEAQLRTARILLEEMQDEDGALRHLREFGQANSDYESEMLLAQGQLLLQLGRPDDALRLLSDAVSANPSDPSLREAHAQIHVIVAQRALELDDLRAAEALLQQGLDAYPGHVSLRYARVLLQQRQNQLRRAANELEALVAEYPDNPTLLNALGYLLTDELNRHTEARQYIQRALALEPDNAAIIDSMGWVLFKLGELDAALDYLERALRLEADPEIAAHVVSTRLALGQREPALQLLDDMLSQHPDSPHLLELVRQLRR